MQIKKKKFVKPLSAFGISPQKGEKSISECLCSLFLNPLSKGYVVLFICIVNLIGVSFTI